MRTPRNGCAGWGSAPSPPVLPGALPRRCFSPRTRTSARCSWHSSWRASWPIFAAYAAAIALPFTYVLATFGNRLFAEIALLIPLFYGVSVAIAFRLNGVFLSGYRLRHAYQRQLVELQEARRQIEASGRKLALFAERAPIAVLELDAKGVVHEVNQAAELLFGYAADELTGHSVKRLVQ